MRMQRLYSESEVIKKTGYTLRQLEEKANSGFLKTFAVNGKKYYKGKVEKL